MSTTAAKTKRYTTRGFTIVELLIVIVVIAILATITVVAYNGIQDRSNDAAVQSDLNNAKKKIELYKIDNSEYPDATTAALTPVGMSATKNAYDPDAATYNYSYCTNSSSPRNDFALLGLSKSGTVFYVSSSGQGVSAASSANRSNACIEIGLELGGSDTGVTASGLHSGSWNSWVAS